MKSPISRKRWIKLTYLVAFQLALGGISSCSEKTSKNPNQTSSNPAVSTETTQSSPNIGPSGSSDPVDPNGVGATEPIEYYPESDPVENVLPGTPFSACGMAYKQFNNPVIYFKENGGGTFFLQEFSYDSVTFLRNVKFGSDSFNLCLEGYRDNSNIYLNTTTQVNAATNPFKVYQNGEFTHEICGHLAYVQNFSGQTSLNLMIGSIYYLINNENNAVSLPSGVPTLASSITTSNSVEACLYSSKASYKNFNESFKPQFDIEGFDMGALNP